MNFITTLFFCVLPLFYAPFQGCYSAATPPGDHTSSVVLPVTGNVYPTGYYHATLSIGNPPKSYFLDIDTGSDLTWLQCDAPCTKCTPAPHKPYKPNKELVECMDPLCESVHWPETHQCQSPKEQCDYTVQYADDGSSIGVLVKDSFSLQYINGTVAKSILAFGCGYNQEVPASMDPPYTDGILGLGLGKASILHQLRELGVTRSVVGHCLSAKGGGYLFFGDQLVPSSGVVWTPMSTTEIEKHYSLGTAELFLGGKTTRMKGLPIVFDSGSTYTYFSGEAYKALYSMLMNDMKGKKVYITNEDKSLPVCWKGSKPFKSIYDVKNLFEPIILKFKKSKFQLNPESYLIISKNGNACFGILNGSEVGLENINVIGDISFQDKIIIYDNEKQQIGWTPANCNRLPKNFFLFINSMDDDDDDGDGEPDSASLCKPYGSNLGILPPYCTAN
ncbi:aspartic proteinase Asp1 isoform X1 [Lactuca sativa]|uniref:aspartic proteinase Asp1 isoform X1 n=1 Tax=Lactuca sativa TaxID=4236 RepID=UPI000CD9865C|nr:aspartic proteinase Asp1 isoform X1 [Lactuca sativa]